MWDARKHDASKIYMQPSASQKNQNSSPLHLHVLHFPRHIQLSETEHQFLKMIGPTDLSQLQNIMTPAPGGIPFAAEPPAHTYTDNDYDVSHLDFGYVATCTDVEELKILLGVLRFVLITERFFVDRQLWWSFPMV